MQIPVLSFFFIRFNSFPFFRAVTTALLLITAASAFDVFIRRKSKVCLEAQSSRTIPAAAATIIGARIQVAGIYILRKFFFFILNPHFLSYLTFLLLFLFFIPHFVCTAAYIKCNQKIFLIFSKTFRKDVYYEHNEWMPRQCKLPRKQRLFVWHGKLRSNAEFLFLRQHAG